MDPSPSALLAGLSPTTAPQFAVFTQAGSLLAGRHVVAYGSSDENGNFEPLRVSSVVVDAVPPVTSVAIDEIPADPLISSFVILQSTFVSFAAADGGPADSASGLARIEVSVDDGDFVESLHPLNLDLGTHTVIVRAIDRAGNVEVEREFLFDVRPIIEPVPPQTTLAVAGGRFVDPDGTEFISAASSLTLTAIDPLTLDFGFSGVRESRFSTAPAASAPSTSSFQLYATPFGLPEGETEIRFFSLDNAGNFETVRSSRIIVDGTPPLATASIQGSSATSSLGQLIVGPESILALESTDPVSNGVAAGIAATLFLLDPGPDFCGLSPEALPVAISTAPQGSCANPYFIAASTLSAGEHRIAFIPVDNVGNLGALSTATIHVDADGPSAVTDLAAMTADETSLTISWTAPDDEIAGVAAFELRIATRIFDETNFHLLSGVRDPPPLVAPGALVTALIDGLEVGATYYLAVRSRDRVGNNSGLGVVLRAATRGVPLPPPLTGISFIRKITPQGYPQTVTADSQGNVFIVYGSKIAKYSPEGQLLLTWDSLARGGGQVFAYSSARIGPNDRLYLLAFGTLNGVTARFVQVFDTSGNFVRNISASFNAAKALDFDSHGNLWVYDSGLGKLLEFDPSDALIRQLTVGAGTPGTSWGGMAIDAQDNIFVSQVSDGRIYRFSGDGSLAGSFPANGGGNGAQRAEAMDIDSGGRLHVADTGGAVVVVYSQAGSVLARYGTAAVTPGAVFEFPWDVFLATRNGKAWIADQASKPAVYEFLLSSSPLPIPEIISPQSGARIAAADPLIVGFAPNGSRIEALEGGNVVSSTIVTRQDGTFYLRPQLPLGPHLLSVRGASNLGTGSEPVALAVTVESTSSISFEPPALKRFPAWAWANLVATATVTSDFNGDGKLDIFAIGDHGYVVLLGDGGGDFVQLPIVLGPNGADGFPTTALFENITRAFGEDFNRDGKMDVILGKDGGFLIFSGKGDGTFEQQAAVAFTLPAPFSISDITTGDFNGDGLPDVAIGSWGYIQVALGNGNFTFTLKPYLTLPGSGQPRFLIVHAADFNSDGRLDLVNDGTVIYGDGLGDFAQPQVLCSVCDTPLVGDFNSDGKSDVAVRVFNFFSPAGNGLQVFLGRGDGRFASLPLQPDTDQANGALVGRSMPDFNLDARGDLGYAGNTGAIRLFASRGDGVFRAPQAVSPGSGCSLESLSHGDLNGDGSDDLVVPLNFFNCGFDDLAILFNKRDLVAPATVTDLTASATDEGTVVLSWTAPGDNGFAGQATAYDLRSGNAPLPNLVAFENASPLTTASPRRGGQSEVAALSGLPAGAEVFFALRARDEVGNTGGLSNSASAAPLFAARSAASELLVTAREVQPTLAVVSTQSTQGLVLLASAAPQALALVSSIYELGPAAPVLTSTANAFWTYTAAQVAAANVIEQDIGLYRFSPSAGWVRVSSQTRDAAQRRISASLTQLDAPHALFGLIHDVTPPETMLSAHGGLDYFDPAASRIYYSSQTAFALSAFDPLSRSTASGVALSEFRVDPASPAASFEAYIATFSLADGSHRIEFRSADFAQNVEPVRSSSVFVDVTAPGAAFEVLSASTVAGGTIQFHEQARVTVAAADPALAGPEGTPGSGVAEVFLLIDHALQECGFPEGAISPTVVSTGAPQGSCENPRYVAPFTLSVGSHVLLTQAIDNLANRGDLRTLLAVVTTAPAPDPREIPHFEFLSKFARAVGEGNGWLQQRVTDIEIAEDGNIYVADAFNALVQVFDANGVFVRQWGGIGSGPGKFTSAFLGSTGLSLNRTPNGTLWVADGFRLQEFSREGQYVSEMTFSGFNPIDVAVDGAGKLYVSGTLPLSGSSRPGQVRVFDTGRNLLTSWLTGDTNSILNANRQIAVDSNDGVYLLVSNQSLVKKFTAAGAALGTVGSPGDADGHFNAPRGIALDVHDNLYVSDLRYDVLRGRVQVFTSTGAFITSFGPVAKSSAGYLRSADDGIGVDRLTGVVYVADTGDDKGAIKKYAPDLTAPAPPSVETPASGLALSADRPLVVGQAELTSRVELREGPTTLATSAVDGTSGRFVMSAYQSSLGPGAYALSLVQVDPAGHVSEAEPLSLMVSAPVSLNLSSRAAVSTVVPGDGFFVTQTPRLAAGDFDGDGLPDLVTFLSFGHAFAKGAGNGTFTMNKMDFSFGASNSQEDLAVADFDRDGKLDVLVARQSSLVLLKGAGNGTFPNRTTLSFGSSLSRRLAVADFNGDGYQDAVVMPFPFTSAGPTIYFGGAGGAFTAGPTLADRGSQGRALLAADLNGDGAADIFAGARIYHGNGAGAFPSSENPPLPGERMSLDAAALDLNADGRLDLAVTLNEGLYSVLNLPAGVLTVANGVSGIDSLTLADADQDGRPDLWAMAGSFTGLPRVKVLINLGDGRLGLPSDYQFPGTSDQPLQVPRAVISDFDDDGVPDAAMPYIASNQLTAAAALMNRTDNLAPSAVTDLAVRVTLDGAVNLQWTAPGDDGTRGRAAAYQLRYNSGPIADFEAATPLALGVPHRAGSLETAEFASLPGGQTLHFAMRAIDDVGHIGALSNEVSTATVFVAKATNPVNGLPELTFTSFNTQPSVVEIGTTTETGAVVLGAASADSLYLVGRIYEVGPEGFNFNPPAQIAIRYSPEALAEVGIGEADLRIYEYDSVRGLFELPGQVIDTENKVVYAPLNVLASIFGLYAKVTDRTAPRTALRLVGGTSYLGAAGELYISSSTRHALDAADPIVLGTASGVAYSEYRVDAATSGPAFATFTEPFGLGEGLRLVEYRSADAAGNVEVIRSTAIRVDATPPMTSLGVGSPAATREGVLYISSTTPFTLTAQDPLGGDVAAGLKETLVSLGTGPFLSGTTEPFRLPGEEGEAAIHFFSRDLVLNEEAVRSTTAYVDLTAPALAVVLPPSSAVLGDSSHDVALGYADAGAGADPASLRLELDGVPVSTQPETHASSATARLTAPDGRHTLQAFLADAVGNVTSASASYRIDTIAPEVTVSVAGGTTAVRDGLLHISLDRPVLSATTADGGLDSASLTFSLDGLPLPVDAQLGVLSGDVVSASLSTVPAAALAGGTHTLSISAADLLGRVSSASLTFLVDSAPPEVSLASPLGGESFIARHSTIEVRFSVADGFDARPSSAAFLVQLVDRGSSRGERPATVPVVDGQFLDPLSLDDGSWRLEVTAADLVANSTQAAGAAFEVVHDVRSPMTALAVGQPQASGGPGGALFVTSLTSMTLVSRDDLAAEGDGGGLGTARQLLQVDGAERATFENPVPLPDADFRSTFTLAGDAPGLRVLSYSAVDVLGNLEPVRASTVAIDDTAPQSSLLIAGGRQAPAGGTGAFYASTDTVYGIVTLDPEVGGVAAGLETTFLRVREAAPAAVSSTFTLSAGRNELAYWSLDRLANLEVARATTALVDGTPPVSAAAVGLPSFIDEGGVSYVSSSTLVALNAADPAFPDGTAGSGVERIEVSLDDAAFTGYTSSLTFSEGRRVLGRRALDRVANVEGTQTLELRSDASAPETSLAVLGGRQAPGPEPETFYASSDTRFALPAADRLVSDVASGLDSTRWQDNGGALQAYAAPLAFEEGVHRLSYGSLDRVANAEVLRSTIILVDATAPRSDFALGTPSFVDSDGTSYVSPTTPVSFAAADPALASGTAGSGVARIEVAVDGGAFTTYTGALTFAQGRHTVLFRSVDGVGNVEAAQALALRSDAAAPETSLAVQGGRQAPGPDAARFYASPDTRYALPAADPAVADVASGVELTRWRNAEGEFQAYSAPIALPEGSHLLSYQSSDRVANLEVLRSTTVLVDAAAPRSSFTIGSPAFVAADGTRYVASGTQVAFSAEDPALPGGTAGSGVARVEVAVDGGPYQAYSAALGFSQGRHTLLFRAVDRVGNVEAAQTLALRSDATPPVTALVPSGAYYASEGRDYAPAQFTYNLSAADPVVADVASGVAETLSAVDAGAMQTITAPFTLAEGVRVVSAQSRDNVANLEEPRASTVHVDASAPLSSLAVQGGRQAPGPDGASLYASADTRFALSAVDPVVSGVASGLDLTRWQDNGGAFQTYAAPLGFAEGVHRLSYQSQDRVTNLEVLRSTTVFVDAMPPQSAFQVGAPSFVDADGTRYLTPATPVTFSAQDPALPGGTAGSGVARIEVSLDGADYVPYTAALTFAEGRHVVLFRALDRVGNVEAAQTLALRSDASAPLTSLAVQGGRQGVGPDAASFYTSPDTRFALPAVDPVFADVASGLESTSWQDNGSAFQAYSAPLALGEGSHLLSYRSRDRVQNLEVLRSTTALIDATPPVTAFQLGAPSYTDAAGVRYVTPDTPVTFNAADPGLPGGAAGSGVERIEVAVDGGDFQPYSAALRFAAGVHAVLYRAADRVGNVEAARTLALRSDAAAPQSSFAAQGGRQVPGPDASRFYASADTRYVLSALDPVVAEAASGVDFIRWQDNGGAFQTYTAPLALAEGSHVLAYQGQDKVQNVETLRSTTVLVDATAPRTAFQIGTPAFIDPGGTRYITPTTPVTFTAEDPALPGGGVGAGVERIEVAVDGGAFVAYAAALTFPEGRHTVQFRAMDRVGNVEAAQTLALRSDASSPLTSLDIQGGRHAAAADAATFYASSATRYALLATDPVVADVASGVEITRWQDNGGSLMSYSGPITFPEGVHVLTYASEDRVRNVEAQKAATVLVDATPPITQFSLNGPRYAHVPGDQSVGGELFISPTTGIELAALDPISNGVASGLERTLASADGEPFLPWAGFLSFAQETTHVVAYRSADRVGNEEGTRSVSVSVDATPPATLLSFDGPALLRGQGTTTWEPQHAEAFVTSATKLILTTIDRVSGGNASGTKLTRFRIDSGPWQVYAGPIYLYGQGLHLLEFAAEDRVGNVEAVVQKRIAVDNTAPLVSAAINGPTLEAFGLNLLSTAATVSLTGNDSPTAGVAVGLARLLYRIDDGGWLEYAAPFAMGPGSHTVQYQGVDLLGNIGAPQTLSVRVMRFLGGSLAATGSIEGSGTADVSGLLQTDGGLALSGNFEASGGAEAFSISTKGGAALTGPVTQGVRPLSSDWIDLGAIQTVLSAANDNARLPAGALTGGVLRLKSGQSVTLATGAYLLDGLELSGGAKLLTTGPVRLFVTGAVKLGGNSALNEAGPARNLVIFGSGASANLAASAASAVLYLPAAAMGLSGEMRLGGSALAGSISIAGNSNAAAPGLEASAPAATSAGKGGKVAVASLAGGIGLVAGPLDTTFVLRDIYAFPNPAVRGQRPVLHAAVGIADKVTFRLYDIAGTPVHEATLDGAPQVIDDGSGPKYAYEHTWDGHIPSGVYLYVVTAEKSGHAPIKRVGKLAVVR
ncbi:MAG: VCBS repeat-containing protein [Elusimicrobia bacterium]|nr:VCBS repeat-containing protein [Elusimicrobiota bacterium]